MAHPGATQARQFVPSAQFGNGNRCPGRLVIASVCCTSGHSSESRLSRAARSGRKRSKLGRSALSEDLAHATIDESGSTEDTIRRTSARSCRWTDPNSAERTRSPSSPNVEIVFLVCAKRPITSASGALGQTRRSRNVPGNCSTPANIAASVWSAHPAAGSHKTFAVRGAPAVQGR